MCYAVLLRRRVHTGEITMKDFEELNQTFPMLLFPAFRLQDHLQAGTLGKVPTRGAVLATQP